MKNEMFNKEDFRKIKEFFEEFSKTKVGYYIVNWLIGILGITVVVIILFILICFATWSIPSLSSLPTPSKGFGTLVRMVILVYSFVVLLITYGDNDDDYGY